jgi:hypothetical protein
MLAKSVWVFLKFEPTLSAHALSTPSHPPSPSFWKHFLPSLRLMLQKNLPYSRNPSLSIKKGNSLFCLFYNVEISQSTVSNWQGWKALLRNRVRTKVTFVRFQPMLVGFEFWLGLGSDLGFLNKWVLLREGHLSEGVSPQGCSQTSRRTHQEYRNNSQPGTETTFP